MWERPAADDFTPSQDPDRAQGIGKCPASTSDSDYDYSPAQVMMVRESLLDSTRLPLELIDLILDAAQVWACTYARRDFLDLENGCMSVKGGKPATENFFCLRTLPLGLDSWSLPEGDADWWWSRPCPPSQTGRRDSFSLDKLANLASYPLSPAPSPIKKIKFYVSSKDQGWGGDHECHGTFKHSHTWFSVGVEQFEDHQHQDSLLRSPEPVSSESNFTGPDPQESSSTHEECLSTSQLHGILPVGDANSIYQHELHPSDQSCVQRNRLCGDDFERHTCTWQSDDAVDPDSPESVSLDQHGRGRATGNGEFVRALRYGDVLTIWAHARFPGWKNDIKVVGVKVYFRV